jgi:prepilin-type N-terminal cleavage/methylation domain-containing protein
MNKKGFTFVEIAVTLAILAIISAISIPSYFSWLPRYRLQTSVRQIYDDMNMAKFRAVRINSDSGIEFDSNNENYRVFIDTDQDQIRDAGETVISTGTLENGVDIIQTTFAANTYGFNSRGMAAGTTGDVYLTNPSGLFLGVRVNSAGGLTIINSTDGGTTWS